MARTKRAKGELEVNESEREERPKRGRRAKILDEDEGRDNETAGLSSVDLLAVDLRAPHEPDAREVESLTDRIFGSVLSRYGWQVHNGHSEHVGAEQHAR